MRQSKYFSTAVTAVLLLVFATAVRAETDQPVKPLALQGVMQQLGHAMQAVTGAIATEDWFSVAQLAEKIAQHAEPPLSEKVRILAWLGSDAKSFRGLDGQLKDAANTLADTAKSNAGRAVITAFSEVQHSCLACHQKFREPFVNHFYGTQNE